MLPLESLVEIHALRYSEEYNPQSLEQALEAICAKTLNVSWYTSVCVQLRGLNIPVPPSSWTEEAQDEYNAKAKANREAYHKASGLFDTKKVAEASIEEGLWHLNGGEFRLAQAAFNAARTADPTRAIECLYYTTQIDLLQREYSLVTSAVGKQFANLLKRREKYVPEILLSYALALWQSCSFSDVAVVLLHVIDFKNTDGTWPWLSSENLATMCVLCSILTLDRQNLEYLAHSDLHINSLLEEFPHLREIIVASLDVDIDTFNRVWGTIEARNYHYLLRDDLKEVHKLLREKLLRNYLAVRSQCSLDDLLKAFAVSNILELSAETRRKGYPIQIDPINRIARVVPLKATNNPEIDYIQDSAATIWHSIEATHGPGLEAPPQARDYRQQRPGRQQGKRAHR